MPPVLSLATRSAAAGRLCVPALPPSGGLWPERSPRFFFFLIKSSLFLRCFSPAELSSLKSLIKKPGKKPLRALPFITDEKMNVVQTDCRGMANRKIDPKNEKERKKFPTQVPTSSLGVTPTELGPATQPCIAWACPWPMGSDFPLVACKEVLGGTLCSSHPAGAQPWGEAFRHPTGPMLWAAQRFFFPRKSAIKLLPELMLASVTIR